MADALVPCPDCSRHVRITEERCPFCACALPDTLGATLVPSPSQGLSRAAAFAFGASVAVAVSASSACNSTVSTPLYGASIDAGAYDGSPDGSRKDASPAPLYGAVPVDAAPDADNG